MSIFSWKPFRHIANPKLLPETVYTKVRLTWDIYRYYWHEPLDYFSLDTAKGLFKTHTNARWVWCVNYVLMTNSIRSPVVYWIATRDALSIEIYSDE